MRPFCQITSATCYYYNCHTDILYVFINLIQIRHLPRLDDELSSAVFDRNYPRPRDADKSHRMVKNDETRTTDADDDMHIVANSLNKNSSIIYLDYNAYTVFIDTARFLRLWSSSLELYPLIYRPFQTMIARTK